MDLEMVVNERDILGAQLLKKNQELLQLYEKLKLPQSNFAKGEIFNRERMADLKGLQIQLINLRKELQST